MYRAGVLPRIKGWVTHFNEEAARQKEAIPETRTIEPEAMPLPGRKK
jgi:hypothetical protein